MRTLTQIRINDCIGIPPAQQLRIVLAFLEKKALPARYSDCGIKVRHPNSEAVMYRIIKKSASSSGKGKK